MNGTIVDKDVAGIAIDYLTDINGTKCYLSFYQPYEEYIGDEVTMNGKNNYFNLINLSNYLKKLSYF